MTYLLCKCLMFFYQLEGRLFNLGEQVDKWFLKNLYCLISTHKLLHALGKLALQCNTLNIHISHLCIHWHPLYDIYLHFQFLFSFLELKNSFNTTHWNVVLGGEFTNRPFLRIWSICVIDLLSTLIWKWWTRLEKRIVGERLIHKRQVSSK